jgi:anti-anti-sigma factor
MPSFTSELLVGGPTFTVTTDVDPPALRVTLEGELDLACADLLGTATPAETAGITTVTVDLTRLEFSDVAGMRALLAFRADHLAADRDVELVGAPPIVRRIFGLSGHGDCLAD